MSTRRIQDFVVRGKDIFVGIEDSKKTWKIALRCEKMLIHQVSMEAKYLVLKQYLKNRLPECTIHVIYEAGFQGFNLFDRLTGDGIDCVVGNRNNRVKTDKRDAKRLALILENNDAPSFCDVPDKERREDRQISRTLIAIQKDIIRNRFLEFHGIETPFTGKWNRKTFSALRELPLSPPLQTSLNILLAMLDALWSHQTMLREHLRVLCHKERYKKDFTIARSAPGGLLPSGSCWNWETSPVLPMGRR